MKHWFVLFIIPLFCSCNKSEEAVPPVITELADGLTDTQGTMTTIINDKDQSYTLTNQQKGLASEALYRGLYSYTLDGSHATLYSYTPAYLLSDSTTVAHSDPLNIASAWSTKRYINLHLTPKTQGGAQHYYGYIITDEAPDQKTITLHHKQNGDPTSYSTDVYASILWSEFNCDKVTLNINTFNGTKTWTFKQ